MFCTIVPTETESAEMRRTCVLGRTRWCAFVAENSTASFLLRKWQEWVSRACFAQLFQPKPKPPKRTRYTRWAAFIAKKFNYKFFVAKVARTGISGMFSTIVAFETVSAITLRAWVLGQTRWIGFICCEKFNYKLFLAQVARTSISVMVCTIVAFETVSVKMLHAWVLGQTW